MSEAMLNTDLTLHLLLIPRLGDSSNKTLVTFACETSTPFGTPVLPIKRVSYESGDVRAHDGTHLICIWHGIRQLNCT